MTESVARIGGDASGMICYNSRKPQAASRKPQAASRKPQAGTASAVFGSGLTPCAAPTIAGNTVTG